MVMPLSMSVPMFVFFVALCSQLSQCTGPNPHIASIFVLVLVRVLLSLVVLRKKAGCDRQKARSSEREAKGRGRDNTLISSQP